MQVGFYVLGFEIYKIFHNTFGIFVYFNNANIWFLFFKQSVIKTPWHAFFKKMRLFLHG